MEMLFTLQKEEVGSLGPEAAVDVFRRLLWAEASASGIALSLIDVPSAITVADGGIDAEVTGVDRESKQGVIQPGLNRYQIKSGNFTHSPSGIKEILLTKDGALKPRIKSCLDSNGRLAIVMFGWDNPDRLDEESIVKSFQLELANIEEHYSDANVVVWRQNTIRGLLENFPSIALGIKKLVGLPIQSRESWVRDQDMQDKYEPPPDFESAATAIQEKIRAQDRANHVRVLGVPGSGKTRFVLEATMPDDIASLVIYSTAGQFLESKLFYDLLLPSNTMHCILVVDECSIDNAIRLWQKLANCGCRVQLITIHNEPDTVPLRDTDILEVPLLSQVGIEAILRYHKVPEDQLQRWAEFIGDSPRFAHLIGTNLREHPENITLPSVGNIYLRLLAGKLDPENPEVRQRWLVLTHLALFKRFGYQSAFAEEAHIIQRIIEATDPNITWQRFIEVVEWFRRQRILQGNTTLYITPAILHIRMWVEWWNQYGAWFDLNDFMQKLSNSPRLIEWFIEMFRYSKESEAAQQTVAKLLQPDGPFSDENLLHTELGSRFFFSLAEADPKSALRCLQRTIGQRNREELLKFTTGRRNILWSLERIAVWREYFSEAARLFLALGEAENETYANNASGMFADLYSPGPGKVAPTEASPEERFPVLVEALTSGSRERRLLGLRACDAALETQHFSRISGAEHQGLRLEPQLWAPKTHEELLDSYRRVWLILTESVGNLDSEEKDQAVSVLLSRSWGLIRIRDLAGMVIDTFRILAEKQYVDKRELLKTIIHIERHPDMLSSQTCEHLNLIKEEMTGTDFPSLLQRYVAMGLLEDRYDEQGNVSDSAVTQIASLAQQAMAEPEMLTHELNWLVTTQAKSGYEFGYELGKVDSSHSLLSLLLEAQRQASENRSAAFLGGYMRSLYEHDPATWEELLDELAGDEQLWEIVPELTWRGCVTDRAALRVLNLARQGRIGYKDLFMFRLGGVTSAISEYVLVQWIEYLLSLSQRAALTLALHLFHYYYLHLPANTLPEDLTFALLSHPILFQKAEGPIDTMDEYYWQKLAESFIQQYPEKRLAFADFMLRHFGIDGSIIDSYNSQTLGVLGRITKDDPVAVWKIITRYIGPPIDTRALAITHWLRGGIFHDNAAVAAFIPLTELWNWVDKDIEQRAWYLASFVPRMLNRETNCLAREVLARYGAREDVRRNMAANFSTEGWVGPQSAHYQQKKQQLLEFRKGEKNPNVRRWIDEYVESLNGQIERAKAAEERGDF